MKYKRVNLKTLADFKQAEKLQAHGWAVILTGIDYVLLEKNK